MRNTRSLFICSAILLAVGSALAAPRHQEAATVDVKVIEMTGDKYVFAPAEIHVKKGEHVRIMYHSVDKEHGVKLEALPEGAKKDSAPGLRFLGKNDTGKVLKGADGSLEFVAEQPGTYKFECSIFCGLGHGRMKGKVVVDE